MIFVMISKACRLMVLVLTVILLLNMSLLSSQGVDVIYGKVGGVYSKLINLKYVNLTNVINDLNEVLRIAEQCGNVCESDVFNYLNLRLNKLDSLINDLIVEDAGLGRLETLKLVVLGVAVVATVVLTYSLGPYVVSYSWYLIRRGFRVRLGRRSHSIRWWFLDEEVVAVIAAIAVVASVFAIATTITSGRVVEPFSALGLLGPEGKIGNYPKEVYVGEPVKLYIYVDNHEGKPMYYRVLVKVGNESTLVNQTAPANLPPVKVFNLILGHEMNSTFPLIVKFNETGINVKLITELWFYNVSSREFQYSGRWNHLYINVTEVGGIGR